MGDQTNLLERASPHQLYSVDILNSALYCCHLMYGHFGRSIARSSFDVSQSYNGHGLFAFRAKTALHSEITYFSDIKVWLPWYVSSTWS